MQTDGENTKWTSKVFSIHQCSQNWRQGAYFHITASESWTLPCKSTLYLGSCLYSSRRPRPKGKCSAVQHTAVKLSHLQLRSQGSQSTLGALKVRRLLHLHCPLKWMVCRVLAGGGVLESHRLGGTRKTSSGWSTRKDMACVPSPMSQKCDASQSNSRTPSVFPGFGDTSVISLHRLY